ncbi:MAG: CHAD domain-containing protein [Clostridiaceae bacterium]
MMKTVRELILIRHGKAEDRNADMVDSERKLTQEGAEELKKMFFAMSPYLYAKKSLKIWSSSLLRASQTAGILSEEIGGIDISSLESIGGGDFSNLSKDIAGCEEARTLIIVGHEPYLGEWTENICAQRPDFKKGAAVCIKLESLDPLKGKILWTAQPVRYASGTVFPELSFPETKVKKNIVRSKEAFRRAVKGLLYHGLKEMTTAHKEFMENPDEPESAHKFRVKVRQFRSVLSFLKPEIRTKEYEYFQGKLRELAQKFAYLRELDVMMSGIQEQYPALLELLKKQREEEKKKVCSELAEGTSARLQFELLTWIKDKPVKNSKTSWKPFARFADRRIKEWLSGFEKRLDSIDFSDAKELHLLRIQGKKLRYLIALLEPVLKEKYKTRLPEFKEMQDKLGRVCDNQREIPILAELKAKLADSGAISDIDALIEAKDKELKMLIQSFEAAK